MKALRKCPQTPSSDFFDTNLKLIIIILLRFLQSKNERYPPPKCTYVSIENGLFFTSPTIPSSVTHVTLFSLALFYLYYLILPPKKGPPWCTKRWGCPISSLSLKCVQDDCAHFLSRFEYFQVWKNLARVIWVKWNIFSFVPPASKKIAGGPQNTGED